MHLSRTPYSPSLLKVSSGDLAIVTELSISQIRYSCRAVLEELRTDPTETDQTVSVCRYRPSDSTTCDRVVVSESPSNALDASDVCETIRLIIDAEVS